MDIRVLRYFLAVAGEENITKAAQTLHIAQPSLSKQMMELERELGRQLFIRGKRRLTLTEEGTALRRRAVEIVALLEKTEQEISCGCEETAGEVSIGGALVQSIVKTAAELRAKYSKIKFCFFGGEAADVIERLDHSVLDFAVLIKPIDTLKYNFASLPEKSVWGVLTKQDGFLKEGFVRKEELFRLPLIIHQRAGLKRDLSLWAGKEIDFFNIAGEYNIVHGDPSVFVRNGLGNVLTVDDFADTVSGQELCFRPLEPELKIEYALVWKRRAVLGKAAEAFLREIKGKMKNS